jgi:DNA-directed RNA polymerase specialized sigma24 family protein
VESLLSRIQRKDIEALRDLYREQAPRILAYVSQYLEDDDACHEMLEATFVDLWHLDKWPQGDAFSTLAALARARLGASLSRLESGAQADSTQFSPSETLPGWFRVRRDQLSDAMATLHGVERECLHLALVEDLPAREMSVLLECTELEVMHRLLLARRRLRKALSGRETQDVA